MKTWLALGIYIVGYLVCARVIWVTTPKHLREQDGAFAAVVCSLIWPVIAAAAAAVLPFLGVGWLISRPTRSERREARRMERDTRQREAHELAATYDLPDPS